MLAIKSLVNFSEDAKTTFLGFFPSIRAFAIACKRCVFPRPTPPYIIRGLKAPSPGFCETWVAAFLANSLCGPSIKASKTLLGFILCLFPALLCLVGSFLLSSSDKMLWAEGEAIDIFKSTSEAYSFIASNKKS